MPCGSAESIFRAVAGAAAEAIAKLFVLVRAYAANSDLNMSTAVAAAATVRDKTTQQRITAATGHITAALLLNDHEFRSFSAFPAGPVLATIFAT